MEKAIKYDMILRLPAGNALPKPPVSTVIGPSGISLADFCEKFNKWSKDMQGIVEFGVIIYNDSNYKFLTKEEYLKYKENIFFNIIMPASKFYKEFKEDEDRRFHR